MIEATRIQVITAAHLSRQQEVNMQTITRSDAAPRQRKDRVVRHRDREVEHGGWF